MENRTHNEKSLQYARRSLWATVASLMVTVVGVIISAIAVVIALVALVAAILPLENSRWEAFKSCLREPSGCRERLEIALKEQPSEKQGTTVSPRESPKITAGGTPDKPVPEYQPPAEPPKIEHDKVYVYTGQTHPICGELGWRVYPAVINTAGPWFLSKAGLNDRGPVYLNIGTTVTIGTCRLKLDSVEPPNSSRSESLLIFVKDAL